MRDIHFVDVYFYERTNLAQQSTVLAIELHLLRQISDTTDFSTESVGQAVLTLRAVAAFRVHPAPNQVAPEGRGCEEDYVRCWGDNVKYMSGRF